MFSSRGPDLDMDKCVKMSGGNRFEMILMAANRAREIAEQQKNDTSVEISYPVLTSLFELQNRTTPMKKK